MTSYSKPQESSTEAANSFIQALLDDTSPAAKDADTSIIKAEGFAGGTFRRGSVPFERGLPYSGGREFTDLMLGEVTTVPIAPWKGPLKRRRANQLDDLRKRLEDPKAVMLVKFGTTYSERSAWKVFWLYFKTNYLSFRRLKKLFKRK